MPRPFWSGQIQISLVSFGVNLFPAVEAKSEIHFHQLSRKTGERIHHQKFAGDDGADGTPVEKDDIVKGYEYRKGEYIAIEPAEIEKLRIPSRNSVVVSQFVDLSELDFALFEKPYFVVPEGDGQTEAFNVIRQALDATRKVAIGKIAFGGREHVIAVTAASGSKTDEAASRGMMAYTLRYAEELRDPAEYFSNIKKTPIESDQLSLAKDLIQRKSAPFVLDKFQDEYEAALKELVEAKVNHQPLPKDESPRRSPKVVSLMDALRKSVQSDTGDASDARSSKPAKKQPAASKQGPRLLKAAGKAKPGKTRKSA